MLISLVNKKKFYEEKHFSNKNNLRKGYGGVFHRGIFLWEIHLGGIWRRGIFRRENLQWNCCQTFHYFEKIFSKSELWKLTEL